MASVGNSTPVYGILEMETSRSVQSVGSSVMSSSASEDKTFKSVMVVVQACDNKRCLRGCHLWFTLIGRYFCKRRLVVRWLPLVHQLKMLVGTQRRPSLTPDGCSPHWAPPLQRGPPPHFPTQHSMKKIFYFSSLPMILFFNKTCRDASTMHGPSSNKVVTEGVVICHDE